MSRKLENDMDDINVRFPNLNLSRRQLLAGLASAGAGALLRGDLHAQSQRRVIDVHHHIVPPQFMAAHRDDMVRGGAGQPYVQAWTPQVSLDQMDSQGVATSILSLSTPGTWFGSVQDGRKMSRLVNDYAAQMGRDHPGRFGLFAPPDSGSRYRRNFERNRIRVRRSESRWCRHHDELRYDPYRR